MNIPDEAVEAAFAAFYEKCDADFDAAHAIHAALVAAAPLLMAQAWDEGGVAAIEREHAYGREEKSKFSNPYREGAV